MKLLLCRRQLPRCLPHPACHMPHTPPATMMHMRNTATVIYIFERNLNYVRQSGCHCQRLIAKNKNILASIAKNNNNSIDIIQTTTM
ncbi:hypothetical protein ACLKA6_003604 [Drosophila palustris]